MGLKYPSSTRPSGRVWLKSDQNGIEINPPSHHSRTRGWVKIRPKWDWNLGDGRLSWTISAVKIRPKWDWNKFRGLYFSLKALWLKSDQNGIEISPSFARFRTAWLKSDQNGIEIATRWMMVMKTLNVKIRPKWDWNLHATCSSSCCCGLKSDQNGIEMRLCMCFLVFSTRLKSDQNGIEMSPATRAAQWGIVKIRPKWDWNFLSFPESMRFLGVKIRPKWDWNELRRPLCSLITTS